MVVFLIFYFYLQHKKIEEVFKFAFMKKQYGFEVILHSSLEENQCHSDFFT